MKLTTEIMDKLLAWKKTGRKSIEISIRADVPTIWIYDNEIMEGMFIDGDTDIDRLDIAIIDNKRKELLQKLDYFNKLKESRLNHA